MCLSVFQAADGHADVFLRRVANDLGQVPPHRSEPNLHRRQRRGCPEKGIGACALEVAGVHSLASRKNVKPIGRRPIAVVEPPGTGFQRVSCGQRATNPIGQRGPLPIRRDMPS